MVLLPFLVRYKHSANFHDVMNSASAFYSTNQIALVMEYSTYRYWNTEVFVVTSWLHHGYIMVTSWLHHGYQSIPMLHKPVCFSWSTPSCVTANKFVQLWATMLPTNWPVCDDCMQCIYQKCIKSVKPAQYSGRYGGRDCCEKLIDQV